MNASMLLALTSLLLTLAWPVAAAPPSGLAYGTVSLPDGARYEGELRSGQPNGRGTLYWQDGALYHGQFQAGERSGRGLLRLPDGSSHRVVYASGRMVDGPIAAVQFERQRAQLVPRLDTPDRIAIEMTVEEWLDAWSRQDVNGYLAAYHRGFTPPDGMQQAEWAALRANRVAGPQWIRLNMERLEVNALPGGDARVSFVQRYTSDRFADVVVKQLILAEDRGRWRIVEETARTP